MGSNISRSVKEIEMTQLAFLETLLRPRIAPMVIPDLVQTLLSYYPLKNVKNQSLGLNNVWTKSGMNIGAIVGPNRVSKNANWVISIAFTDLELLLPKVCTFQTLRPCISRTGGR